MLPTNVKDITGLVFARAKVLKFVGLLNHKSLWECECDCGNIFTAKANDLKTGTVGSCGCLKLEIRRQKAERTQNNIVNKMFSRLLVLSVFEIKGDETTYHCLCSCGNMAIVRKSSLLNGHTKSCGCYKTEVSHSISQKTIRKYVGKKFGKLEVIYLFKDKYGSTTAHCLCDCGRSHATRIANLNSNDTNSCGCYKKERLREGVFKHGLSEHPLYDTWNTMLHRCYNSNTEKYAYYGGRGISVCDEWRITPTEFINWAEKNGWSPNLTLDRIDNDGNYEPNNCQWITMVEQVRKQAKTKFTQEKIDAIRKDKRPSKVIAEEYNTSAGYILSIKAHRAWKQRLG